MTTDDPQQQIRRAARSAHRWAGVSMWLSGCALAVYAGAILLGVAAVVWVWLAVR